VPQWAFGGPVFILNGKSPTPQLCHPRPGHFKSSSFIKALPSVGCFHYERDMGLKFHEDSGQLRAKSGIHDLISSRDPVMEPVLRRIESVARHHSNVVVTGESGTGKELVAKALHELGSRKNGPFVAVNCAALPESLLESELFGYARGAFTDARADRAGLFARAQGGTLFLDEVGDASQAIQAKLLRVVQEREFLPLGGRSPIRADFRLLAATHRDLPVEIARGNFREDLYYRLKVIEIRMPPLRERARDVLYLATLFAAKLAREMQLEYRGITSSAELLLETHPWPGNVRELQNRIEHALVLSHDGWLAAEDLFPERVSTAGASSGRITEVSLEAGTSGSSDSGRILPYSEAKKGFEQSYLFKVLAAARGNITQAARLASKSRTEIYALLRKHGLEPGQFKAAGKTRAEMSRLAAVAGDRCDPIPRKTDAEFEAHSRKSSDSQ
jgi:two-component system response regulator GlrR